MMTLFHSTGTCSTACHIAFEEAGIPYKDMEVSWERDLNVEALEKVNPLGAVPALVTDDGHALTQNTAILEYLADLKPTSHLLPERGTWARTEAMSWVAFVASDFQRAFSPFFQASMMTTSETVQAEIKAFAAKRVQSFLKHIDENLAGKQFIAGNQYTVADIYLFTILGWAKWHEIDVKEYANIPGYMRRIYDRPAVQKVLKAEDLLDYV